MDALSTSLTSKNNNTTCTNCTLYSSSQNCCSRYIHTVARAKPNKSLQPLPTSKNHSRQEAQKGTERHKKPSQTTTTPSNHLAPAKDTALTIFGVTHPATKHAKNVAQAACIHTKPSATLYAMFSVNTAPTTSPEHTKATLINNAQSHLPCKNYPSHDAQELKIYIKKTVSPSHRLTLSSPRPSRR